MRRLWLCSLLAPLGSSACFGLGFDDDRDHDGGFQPSTISLADGATVDVTLEYGGLCDNDVDTGCLSERPRTILEIRSTRASVVEVGPAEEDSRGVVVELHAAKVGTSELRVTYETLGGQEVRDVVKLRVTEIDHVSTRIHCDTTGHDGDVYPVTTQGVFHFRQEAFDSEGNPLAVGGMELVDDFAGFEVDGPPEEDGDTRWATAPSVPGTRLWQLVGENSAPVDFRVFPPGQFDLALSASSTNPFAPGVRLERVVDDAPVCVHSGDAFASVEVVGGTCRPLLAGTEIVGPVPVDLGNDAVEVGLAGTGSCRVQATRAGGGATTLSLEVDNPGPTPEPGLGTALGPTPVAHGGQLPSYGSCTPTRNLTNGRCEIVSAAGFILPGADCLYDVRWLRSIHDRANGDEQIDGELLGVGLAAELRVKIEYVLIGFIPMGAYSPNNLVLDVTPDGLARESRGCSESRSQVLAITPQSEGDFDVRMTADNAFDGARTSIGARTVDRFQVAFGPETLTGSNVWYFVGNPVEVIPGYRDAAGNILHGTAPILVSADDGATGTTIESGEIGEPSLVETGTGSNIVTVTSATAPDVHRLHVAAADDIGAVQGLATQGLAIGDSQCIVPVAVRADGTRIHGDAPVRPRIQLIGDSTVVFEATPFPYGPTELCLRAVESGTTELDLGWGTANSRQTWTVR